MKRFFVLFLLIGAILLNACGTNGQSVPETSVAPSTGNTTESLSADEIFNAFLVKLCDKLNYIIVDDTHLDGFSDREGMSGVGEIAILRELNMLDKIGYVITDINNDAIEELLIIKVDQTTDTGCTGKDILCAYTAANNAAALLFEGNSQNSYYLLDDSKFYNSFTETAKASNGIYQLNDGSTALNCVDFYFADNNAYFHNQTGSADSASSKVLDGGADAYQNITNDLTTRIKQVEITPLSGFNG